jgi:hypothetical protein
MAELNSIQIPKSVNSLETLITRPSLMRLMQVAHVFDKIKKAKKNKNMTISEKIRRVFLQVRFFKHRNVLLDLEKTFSNHR